MSQLSQSRIKMIMKTADGVNNIAQDAVFLTTKATELFIKTLVKEGCKDMVDNKGKKLNYNNLVNVIHNASRYEFLEIVIPKKITFREYKDLMKKKGQKISQYDNHSSSSENESSSDSETSKSAASD